MDETITQKGYSLNRDKTRLLISLLEKPKYLDMGRSPVTAIGLCYELADDKLLVIGDDGWVSITDRGRQAVAGMV